MNLPEIPNLSDFDLEEVFANVCAAAIAVISEGSDEQVKQFNELIKAAFEGWNEVLRVRYDGLTRREFNQMAAFFGKTIRIP